MFGERGIERANGITSFLVLFFSSSNISIPSFYLFIPFICLFLLSDYSFLSGYSFYLTINSAYLDISLIFFLNISGFRDGILQKEVLRTAKF